MLRKRSRAYKLYLSRLKGYCVMLHRYVIHRCYNIHYNKYKNVSCCKMSGVTSAHFCYLPVSYTHLDVYKRQTWLLCTYILGYPITVRSDHKSISFLKHCKLNHGRLTRWVLALQENNITWEYIPGKQNVAADVLSRVNIPCLLYTSRCV